MKIIKVEPKPALQFAGAISWAVLNDDKEIIALFTQKYDAETLINYGAHGEIPLELVEVRLEH